VTGASRGIGHAIAAAFLAAGDNVTTIDRQGSGNGALALVGDVTDTASINAAFDQAEAAFGPVQVLVANAGATRDGLAMRMSDEDFAAVIDTNLAGAFRCARRAVGSMVRARRGAIVLIGSVVGLGGGAGQANYAASKAGLVGLARALTREVGGRGITVNVIAPGFIETDMTAGLGEKRRSEVLAAVPAGRLGLPDDVAAAAVFLASPGAAYVSGAVLPVDGGLGMGH
jgi:3-oxoacyl-[acyl-carrier protein] reductase